MAPRCSGNNPACASVESVKDLDYSPIRLLAREPVLITEVNGASRVINYVGMSGPKHNRDSWALAPGRDDSSHAAFRPGQLGPVKAKFLADVAYNARVKDLAEIRREELPPSVLGDGLSP